MAATNEIRRSDKLVVGLIATVLALLLWVSWQVRDRVDPGPMQLQTEWTDQSGKVERFTSHRDGDEPFSLFMERHAAAVKALGGQ